MAMKNIQTCLLILLCLFHVRVTQATPFHFRDEVRIPPIWISTPPSRNCGSPIPSVNIHGKNDPCRDPRRHRRPSPPYAAALE
ncbi:hypothetical protein HID58_034742 [Brassica napus]|uniref:Uncharacterized protein n=1 Tax=Brassica napus TaxID=3708 RepID=A0ABQ8C4U9_BRANA|nr:hypothetical protein HID58_034742 [Brassica napus]